MTRDELDTDINRRLDEWHISDSDLSCHDYLGWTQEEYATWFANPDALPMCEVSKLDNE